MPQVVWTVLKVRPNRPILALESIDWTRLSELWVRINQHFPRTNKGWVLEGIRPEATLEYADPGYSRPSPADIKSALSAGGLSGAKAGRLLGVNDRTVRKWTGGEQKMPYAAWRLLLMYVTEGREDDR